MALTSNFTRKEWKLVKVNNTKVPLHLDGLRIPPAWTDVKVDNDPDAHVLATGYDIAGRLQRIYSPQHIADAKCDKFERVRALLSEWDDIRTQIESDLNDDSLPKLTKESALVAYLIYNTGLRPGSNTDTLAKVKAYGATTLLLKHVKLCTRGVRLKFIGKKGVSQNVLVTDPHLVRVMVERKNNGLSYNTPLFKLSSSSLRAYFKTLGSGGYNPKDFRTACGTHLAIQLIGNRQRLPKSDTKKKALLNKALDRVAAKLGNTRAVSRNSYVDPLVLEKILSTIKHKPKGITNVEAN